MTNTQVHEKLSTVEDRTEAGEVTTPSSLAEEMVSKIPSHIFESKYTTFLDPCFGNGAFLVAVINRLRSHGHSITNIESRVYGIELSLRLFNKTSKLLSRYNFCNLFNNDFLNSNLDMKFDVVIGNPPYSKVKNERVRLWSKFIDQGLEVLSESGKLVFVTPSTWLSSTNYSHGILKDRLSYVNISEDVSNFFGKVGGTQRFIYFVAEKHESVRCITKFDDNVEQEFPIMETPFSPVKSSSLEMHSIVRKLYHSGLDTFDWKRMDKVDESPSVIVPRARSINHKVEFQSFDTFGDTTRFKLYVDKELGEAIAHNLNLKIYRQLRWDIRSGAGIAGNFKQLPIPSKAVTNEELYEILNLTEEEIAYANSLV